MISNINKAGKVVTLIDTGAMGNFINEKVVTRLKLPTITRKKKLLVTHVKGGEVGIVTKQVKCYL